MKSRIIRFLNAFRSYEENPNQVYSVVGPSTNTNSYTPRRRYTGERTIISSIYTRISIDFAGIDIRHVQLNKDGRYEADITSSLTRCFTLEPNIDQAPRAFRQDIALSLFDDGFAAVVPVDTTIDPQTGEQIDIETMRIGRITQWYPKHIRVSLYNEAKGNREEIIVEKRATAIIVNPLYEVMNAPNSTLQRLIRKLTLLDDVDEQSSSGKLDIIVQLPYAVKSEQRRAQAETRRQDIEFQLRGSQYGIAYIDGTEKVTQLNRPAENNLLTTIKYLTDLLYSQLGITEAVMNGTADEKTMTNYYIRTIEPLLDATAEAMQRAFLGVKGTDNKEQIKYFRNPFKLIPLSELAAVIDKFSRNEILAPNEIRDFIGLPPSNNPRADQLLNSNMPQKFPNQLPGQTAPAPPESPETPPLQL